MKVIKACSIHQRGALGRPRIEESARSDRCPIWYATPGRVPKIGPRHACKAVWVTSSGEQTFVQVSQALIKTDTLFSSTITANNNSIGNIFGYHETYHYYVDRGILYDIATKVLNIYDVTFSGDVFNGSPQPFDRFVHETSARFYWLNKIS